MPLICRENLKKEVDDAMKKGNIINFNSRPKEECKYIQKVAEDRLLRISVYNNVLIFAAAVGISILLTANVGEVTANVGEVTANVGEVTANVGEVSGIYSLKIVFGVVIGISVIVKLRQWGQKYNRCSEIILNAEERIIDLEP